MLSRFLLLLTVSGLSGCQLPAVDAPRLVVSGPSELTVRVDPASSPGPGTVEALLGVTRVPAGTTGTVTVPALARLVVEPAALVTLEPGGPVSRLELVAATGAQVMVRALDADTVRVEAGPGAVVELSGRTRVVELVGRRATFRAGGLRAQVARLHVQGCEVEVWSESELSGRVDGASAVRAWPGWTPVPLARLRPSILRGD